MKLFAAALFAISTVGAEKSLLKAMAKTKGRVGEGLCGRTYGTLTKEGSNQTGKYYESLEQLWKHKGVRGSAWGVFDEEIKCWFARLVTNKCGGLQPNPDRKKALFAKCTDDNVTANQLKATVRKSGAEQLVSQAEYSYIRSFYPDQKDDVPENNDEPMKALKFVAEKELYCMTLFTIDDGCVKQSQVQTA